MLPSPTRARTARECTLCPPWVECCVHWDGWLLMVGEPQGEPNPCDTCRSNGVLSVVLVHGKWESCPTCGEPALRTRWVRYVVPFDDLPDAIAEFHRREEELVSAS